MTRARLTSTVLAMGAALVCGSCKSESTPASLLRSVRILAVRSDTPFVKPGATFTAEVLAYDGRRDKTPPMRLFWLKDVCLSPTDGLPGDCYRSFARSYPVDQDLTPQLTEGTSASFQAPSETTGPQANALVFVAACAGSLRFVGISARYPDRVPFGCFDGAGVRRGDDHFVFAFFRVFIASGLTNSNPEPAAVTLDGNPLTSGVPSSIPRCGKADVDDCPARELAITIGDEQQEVDPSSAPPGQAPQREQVWTSFFASSGKLESETTILFDARRGRLSDTANDYRGPLEAGSVDLFVVTHDNRSGVSWRTFQLTAE